MPFYQLHLMLDGELVSSLAAAVASHESQNTHPKTLRTCGEEVDYHRGILVRREYAAIVESLK